MELMELTGLERRPDEAMVAGVCAALARRWHVDPLLVRVGAGLLALSAGVGVVLYAWAWLTMPVSGRPQTLLERWYPASRQWTPTRRGTVLLVATLLVGGIGLTASPWSIGPAIVLAGVLLLARSGYFGDTPAIRGAASAARPEFAAGGGEFEQAVRAWQSRLAQVERGELAPPAVLGLGSEPAALRPAASTSTAATRLAQPVPMAPTLASPALTTSGSTAVRVAPGRPAGWLPGPMLLAVAATAGGLAGGLADVERPTLLGESVALAVLAAGLLVSWLARAARPRLAVVGGLCLLAAIATPLTGGPADLVGTERQVVWSSEAQLPSDPQVASASHITYDLRGLDLTDNATVTIEARASQITVLLPSDLPVTIDYQLQAASLGIRDGRTPVEFAGMAEDEYQLAGTQQSRLTLELLGQASRLEVSRG